eukprot:COSAG04_NODE_4310_length_2165_cov_1.371733_3_plen_128_part_00
MVAMSAPQGARSAAGVHVSTFVAPQFDDINPTGWPVARCRSRPKNQQTALKWPGQPPPMEEGEATAHGCSTQPKSLRVHGLQTESLGGESAKHRASSQKPKAGRKPGSTKNKLNQRNSRGEFSSKRT